MLVAVAAVQLVQDKALVVQAAALLAVQVTHRRGRLIQAAVVAVAVTYREMQVVQVDQGL
jgi:hypothetical protein